MHVVITGTNRGIGLELVRQYIERGERVAATVRQPGLNIWGFGSPSASFAPNPGLNIWGFGSPSASFAPNPNKAQELSALADEAGGRLRIFDCDTAHEESVRAFAKALEDTTVDLLINNAGISGSRDDFFGADFDDVVGTFNTNALGPMRVTRALLPHLRRSSLRKIVNISSEMGSIADASGSRLFGYRLSKAALNMATKVLSQDLSGEEFTVLTVHPGWVKTDMGGLDAPTAVEDSVRRMIAEIDRRGPADSGAFFDYTGKTLPW